MNASGNQHMRIGIPTAVKDVATRAQVVHMMTRHTPDKGDMCVVVTFMSSMHMIV